MNLAKALKTKKKLAGDISKHYNRMSEHNSIIEGSTRPFDLDDEYKLAREKADQLVDLKVAIRKAAQPIAHKIHSIEELKNQISRLKSMSVNEGMKSKRFSEETHKYVAQFGAVWQAEEVDALEERLATIQDEIETFNFQTQVD